MFLNTTKIRLQKVFLNLTLLFILSNSLQLHAQNQIPKPALIGYFHNWKSNKVPYIDLDLIDDRYNVIIIAFAMPKIKTTYDIDFKPFEVSEEEFKAQIKRHQKKGKKVLISIGGATTVVKLNNDSEKNIFANSLLTIIEKYGFDGFDIDLEGKSVSITGGTVDEPADASIHFLIEGIDKVKRDFKKKYNKNLLLTFAPETAYVQGGQTKFTGVWGAYLPILQALHDDIDLLQVQLYNSGSMYGLNGLVYEQGSADFIVAMTEAVIQGFDTKGGEFYGFPPEKVAIGLPACDKAAGSGFTPMIEVKKAFDYLTGRGSKPGTYTLRDPYGYPDLSALMTWSINWDQNCTETNQFADNFKKIFHLSQLATNRIKALKFYPDAGNDWIEVHADKIQPDMIVEIATMEGKILLSQKNFLNEKYMCFDTSCLYPGLFLLRLKTPKGSTVYKIVIE